jgi:hypothetical protein
LAFGWKEEEEQGKRISQYPASNMMSGLSKAEERPEKFAQMKNEQLCISLQCRISEKNCSTISLVHCSAEYPNRTA